MHCSIYGKENHNKKGHAKWVESQLEQIQQNTAAENEEEDIPYILQVQV